MSQLIESFIEQIVRKVVNEKLPHNIPQTESIRPLVVANWKMNMTMEKIVHYVQGFSNEKPQAEVVICPPNPYLFPLNALLEKVNSSFVIGAQNVHSEEQGAFTGDVSVSQLKDVGCKYVIIGHSERRAIGETNEMIRKKVSKSLSNDLRPIICIGETDAEHKQLLTKSVVKEQLVTAVSEVSDPSKIIIAYEPIWAIGTGKSATPQQAQEVHHYIRTILNDHFGIASLHIPILYGGSVKPDNARELSSMRDIDGALVGGASLNPSDFKAIIDGFNQEAKH